MIRYLILLFNMIGLLIYHLFLPDVITATQVVPSTVKPGDSFNVEVTITKGTVSSFAKLQEDLPNGFTATEVDSKGGTFSFKDHSVKFIWTALPSDNSFVVKYKITVDATVSGQQSFGGKFSYVVANNRQSVEINASNITVSGDNNQAVATNPVNTDSIKTIISSNSTPVTNNNPTNSTNTSVSATPSSTISGTRTVPSGNVSGSFMVSLSLNHSKISGFAKLEETLPIGFTATAVDKDGASFSFSDQKVKFIWLSLPSDSIIKVSYNVTVDNSISGTQNISGLFAYVQDSTRKYIIPSSTVSITSSTSQAIASTVNSGNSNTTNSSNSNPVANTNIASTNTNTAGNTPVATNTINNNTTTSQNTPTNSANTTNTTENTSSNTNNDATAVSGIPSGKSGVSYSVQIAALHKPVKKSFFVATNKINENIRLEMMDGFTKYVLGNFTEYKSARDHREDIKSKGIVGPFVTAYNTGKRITVQEALMVSNQKWYK